MQFIAVIDNFLRHCGLPETLCTEPLHAEVTILLFGQAYISLLGHGQNCPDCRAAAVGLAVWTENAEGVVQPAVKQAFQILRRRLLLLRLTDQQHRTGKAGCLFLQQSPVKVAGLVVQTKTIDMKFFQPEQGMGKKQTAHFGFFDSEAIAVAVSGLSFIQGTAVETGQVLLRQAAAGGNTLDDHLQSLPVTAGDEGLQLFRSAKLWMHGEITGDAAVDWIQSADLEMGDAALLHCGQFGIGKSQIGCSGLSIAAGERENPGYAVIQPCRLQVTVVLCCFQHGNDAGGFRGVFYAQRIGVCLHKRVAGGGQYFEFIEITACHAGNEQLPESQITDSAHRVAASVPVVEAADHADTPGARGPDTKVDAGCVQSRFRMGATKFEQAVVFAVLELCFLFQGKLVRLEAIGVVQFEDVSPGVDDLKAIVGNLFIRNCNLRFKKPLLGDLFHYHGSFRGLQQLQLDRLREGQKSPDLTVAGLVRDRVRAENGMRQVSVPVMVAETELVGVLNISHPEADYFNDWHIRLLHIYKNMLGQLITNCRLFQQMEKKIASRTAKLQQALQDVKYLKERYESMSMIDDLTGLFNRRYFYAQAAVIISSLERYGQGLCVLILDLDFFKKINDTYGHMTGDQVLIDVAATLKEEMRDSDILVRFGGEEFVVVFTNTDCQNGFIFAERIRKSINALSWNLDDEQVKITVSIDMTCLDAAESSKPGINIDHLIHCADVALYRSKAEGRNRSTIFTQEMLQSKR